MGLFDFIGDLFGGGASSAARNAYADQQRLNAEAQRLRQQGIDYYQRYGAQADTDRQGTRVGNTAYGQMGLRDRESADRNLTNAYAQYARATGLTGYGTPTAEASPRDYATPFNRNLEMGPFRQGENYQNRGDYLTGQARPTSPYDLSETQQQSLNQGVDRINAQRKNALANYRAQVLSGGGQVNPAMERYINEHYDEQTQLATTQAAEAARQQVEDAAAAFIAQFTGQRNLGTAQYGDSLDRQLAMASQALAQGANAPFGQYAAQTANEAATAGQFGQQFQQQANGVFGDLLQLAAFFGSGGFGGGGASAVNPLAGARRLPAVQGNPFGSYA